MSSEGFSPVTVDTYGGLCTLMDRSDLPVGLSPDCQNVEFFPGGVRSRQGLLAYATFSDWVVGIDSYVNTSGVARRLILTRAPILYTERYTGLTPIGNPLEVSAAPGYLGTLRLQGSTLYGRHFFCISDGKRGLAPVKQLDGDTLSAISQDMADAPTIGAPGTGVISAGTHYIAIAGITSTGYTTPTGPVVSTSPTTSNTSITLTNIPILPGNVVRKRIFLSPANSGIMYSLERFVIDNNTTTATLSCTDDELVTGLPDSDFYDLIPISSQLGVVPYHNRTVFWGGRKSLYPFNDIKPYAISGNATVPVKIGLVDLDFNSRIADGTFPVSSAWTRVTGGSAVVADQVGADLLALKLTGDGAASLFGRVRQVQLNVGASAAYYATPGKKYGIRIRARKGAFRDTDTLIVSLLAGATSPPGAVVTMTLTGAQMTSFWEVYTTDGVGAIPNDAAYVGLDIYIQGSTAIPNGNAVWIDSVEIYDVATKNDASLLRVSRPYEPESFTASDGWISVAEGNGQEVRCCFELRGNLYIAKERSLYVTIDNGDVSATWTVDEISNVVGTPSAHGVAMGDGYAVMAGEAGVYMFTGGAPDKLSQEIESLWARVNWVHGHKLWVALDPKAQKVWIGVPLDGATECNTIFVLDFVEGWASPIPSGNGRKWTRFSGQYMCGSLVVKDDGSRGMMLGTQTPVTGRNYLTSATNFAFPSPWSASAGGNPILTTSVDDPINTSTATNWSTAYTASERVWSTFLTTSVSEGGYLFGALWIRSDNTVPPLVKIRIGSGATYSEVSAQAYGTWKCYRVVHHPAKAGFPYLAVVVPAGSGTLDLDVWGAQLKYDNAAQVWTGIWAGGTAGTTVYPIVEPVAGVPYDSTGAFDSYYETAPVGTDLGRSLFDRLIMRIRGTGILQTALVRPSGDVLWQPTTNFQSSPNDDIEIRCHRIDTQVGIRWRTNTILDQWGLRRAGILMRPSEHSVYRGKTP